MNNNEEADALVRRPLNDEEKLVSVGCPFPPAFFVREEGRIDCVLFANRQNQSPHRF